MLQMVEGKAVVFFCQTSNSCGHDFNLITQIVGINGCMQDTDIGQHPSKDNRLNSALSEANIQICP